MPHFAGGTSSDPEEKPSFPPPSLHPKRRKLAIFVAYCGAGYKGMQRNPGAQTIECELERALLLSGAISAPDPRLYDFSRSARTDKGVSAVGQVVSGWFHSDDPASLAWRMNSVLADQIRVLGVREVEAGFSAKKCCDRRRYMYLLPVFALDPEAHPDREKVLARLGSGMEMVRCIECSERGRKVTGIMGRKVRVEKTSDLSDRNGNFGRGFKSDTNFEVAGAGRCDLTNGSSAPTSLDTEGNVYIRETENGSCVPSDEIPIGLSPVSSVAVSCSNMVKDSGRKSNFKYGEEVKERFIGILKRYVGTHNFHNFTTRMKPDDPAAWRRIISFDVSVLINIGGIEFIRCEVLGQSFMLHQIRKMIGFAVAIMRNCAPLSLMDSALMQDVNINVPTAPEVGLYLEECYFTSYNQKWNDTHEELVLDDYADQVEDFKKRHIYPHIASMEHKEGAAALWLHSLNHRNYPDFHFTKAKET